MKTALVYFGKKQQKKTEDLVHRIADSARENGQTVTVFNGYALQDSDHFFSFDYTAVFIADKLFFSAKPDPELFQVLESYRICTGKKCAVFTPVKGLFSTKFSRNAMNKIETLGCTIDYFECIKTVADAQRAGKYIG